MAHNPARPLSPHLTVWKWGPNMLVSILHRATGTVMAIGGGLIFTWWLVAAAMSPNAYDIFYTWLVQPDPMSPHADAQQAVHIIALIVGIGLSWTFFQHLASGVRHLVMDTGAGYELRTNKLGAIATIIFSLLATLAFWLWIFWGKY